MTHSPEPWRISKSFPGATGGKCVLITGVHTHYYEGVDYNTDQEKADAERIVACVNACAGISTEGLLKVTDGTASLYVKHHGGIELKDEP